MRDTDVVVVQLESGRVGCDAQVRAVADRLGTLLVLRPTDDVPPRVDAVMLTGPDRADCARRILAAHPDALCVGFADAGRLDMLDLHVATPQFDHHASAPVLAIDLAISPHGDGPRHRPAGLPEDYGLVLVGGDAGPWTLDAQGIRAAIEVLRARHAAVLVMTSPRTPDRIRARLRRLRGPRVHVDRIGRSRGGVDVADAIAGAACVVVTADSVSMASEAIQASRPVALVPALRDPAAVEAYLEALAVDPDANAMPGRLDRFWASLEAAAPVRTPRLRPFREPSLDVVVGAVRRRMATPLARAA